MTSEPNTEDLDRPSTEKQPGEEPKAKASPADEPSHEAVGIGVIPNGTQDEAAMDVDVASEDDKVAGIVAQTRQDVGGESAERIADVLAQRFTDAGIAIDDARLRQLAGEVAAG